MIGRLYWTATLLVAGVALAGCDAPRAPEPFDDGPKGYVAFYIPADDPAYREFHVGAQVFRVENGQRIFEGSTQKWKKLSPPRHGLTVAVAPGVHAFSVEVVGAVAPVTLEVKENHYHPVRIEAYNITHGQIVGATDHIQFKVRATSETPTPPSAKQP